MFFSLADQRTKLFLSARGLPPKILKLEYLAPLALGQQRPLSFCTPMLSLALSGRL